MKQSLHSFYLHPTSSITQIPSMKANPYHINYLAKKIDSVIRDPLIKYMKDFQTSINDIDWEKIEDILSSITHFLLNTQSSTSGSNSKEENIHSLKREYFINFGGIELLLSVFDIPSLLNKMKNASGLYNPRVIMEKSDTLNAVLVLAREIIFHQSKCSNKLITDQHMNKLFNLLSCPNIFDTALNMLEEILAAKEETFDLSCVSNLYSMFNAFTSRELAHTCRLLSLVLFESEDRMMIEGPQSVRSIELLQLRRSRMIKGFRGIVEKNQNLIIEMPNLLERLIQLLRVMNHGPSLSDLLNYNIVSQVPQTTDILQFFSTAAGINDWSHFNNLENIVNQYDRTVKRPVTTKMLSDYKMKVDPTSTRSETQTLSMGSEQLQSNSNRSPPRTSVVVEDLTEILEAFSPSNYIQSNSYASNLDANISNVDLRNESSISNNTLHQEASQSEDASSPERMIEITNMINVMRLAQRLGIAAITPFGRALYALGTNAPPNVTNPGDPNQLYLEAVGGIHDESILSNHSTSPRLNTRSTNQSSSSSASSSTVSISYAQQRKLNAAKLKAKRELQFHAVLLSPHQIELIFVICTLLSGRRKIFVQQKLAALNLASILDKLYDRLSWDAPPFQGTNPMEHIHGPDCECNPESASRIPVLRLIHNFNDRDFLGNSNKTLFLSEPEKEKLNSYEAEGLKDFNPSLIINDVDERNKEWDDLVRSVEKGLVTKIVDQLAKESTDSIYRFWLSACIENFLRGCGLKGQHFIADSGVLSALVNHSSIFCETASTSGIKIKDDIQDTATLQTNFDLLGEIIKCNIGTLKKLEDLFATDEEFDHFSQPILKHLVESNVFIRCLFISIKFIGMAFHRNIDRNRTTSISANDRTICSLDTFGYYDNCLYDNQVELEHKLMTSSKNPLYFLQNSWVQFNPPVLSLKAIHIHQHGRANSDSASTQNLSTRISSNDEAGGKEVRTSISPDSTSSSSTSSLKVINSGVIKAMKDIRRATTHLLNFTDHQNSRSNNAIESQHGDATLISNTKHLNDSSIPRVKASYLSPVHTENTSKDIFDENDICYVNTTTNEIEMRQNRLFPLMVARRDDEDEDVLEFFTPPEEPRYRKYSATPVANSNRTDEVMGGMERNEEVNRMNFTSKTEIIDKDSPAEDRSQLLIQFSHLRKEDRAIRQSTVQAISDVHHSEMPISSNKSLLTSQNEYSVKSGNEDMLQTYLKDKLPRLTQFIDNEKINILVGLLSVVSVHNINHENICCVNTVLLILLSENDRNQIPKILDEICKKAEEKLQPPQCNCSCTDQLLPNQKSKFNFSHYNFATHESQCCNVCGIDTCQNNDNRINTSSNQRSSNRKIDRALINTERNDQSTKVPLRNFRELLWFWKEYYLRRGRDRLSLEFSSHIAFEEWLALVDLLCMDDGSPCALLYQPMKLPTSPYARTLLGSISELQTKNFMFNA